MPVNPYGTLLHIVKTKQQARQRGFAGTGRTDNRHCFTRRNAQADAVQDRPVCFVSKIYVLKTHFGRSLQCQYLRILGICHFAVFFQQHEHALQVGQALLDLAVNHTQKIQRYVQLNHEGIDHHQVTQAHATLHHAFGGAPQHGYQGHRNDELLTDIERAQRVLCFDAGAAQFVQVFVVA